MAEEGCGCGCFAIFWVIATAIGGYFFGEHQGVKEEQSRAIAIGAAHYETDSRTGETRFVYGKE